MKTFSSSFIKGEMLLKNKERSFCANRHLITAITPRLLKGLKKREATQFRDISTVFQFKKITGSSFKNSKPPSKKQVGVGVAPCFLRNHVLKISVENGNLFMIETLLKCI